MKRFICAALFAVSLVPALAMGAITEPVITSIRVDAGANASIEIEGFNFPSKVSVFMGRFTAGSPVVSELFDKLTLAGSPTATYIRATLATTEPGNYLVALVTGPDTYYSSMVTIETPHQPTNPGISLNPLYEPMVNVPEADLLGQGWSICYQDTYNDSGMLVAGIFSTCNKPNIMLACRPAGNPNFTVASFAGLFDVTASTGVDVTMTHRANGAEWYFNDSLSWGFAAGGDMVFKDSCDTLPNGRNDKRLCWHTGAARLQTGSRCGETQNLNNNSNWERVILHHD